MFFSACKVELFNTRVFGDWLTFGASLKEQQLLALACQLHFSNLKFATWFWHEVIWTILSFYFHFFPLAWLSVCSAFLSTVASSQSLSPGTSFEKHHLQVWVASLTKVRCAHCEIIHTWISHWLVNTPDFLAQGDSLPFAVFHEESLTVLHHVGVTHLI